MCAHLTVLRLRSVKNITPVGFLQLIYCNYISQQLFQSLLLEDGVVVVSKLLCESHDSYVKSLFLTLLRVLYVNLVPIYRNTRLDLRHEHVDPVNLHSTSKPRSLLAHALS